MPASTNIPISATTTGFVAAVNAARASVSNFVGELNTNLSNSFRAADRQSRLFESGIGRLGNNLKSVGQNLSTYLTLPLAGLAGAGLKAASDMEQAGVSFRVLLKDAALAAKTVNELKAFAASTPFEFTEVQEGAKGLLSYGFAVGDLKTLLTDAGNLASGFGVKITEVTRVLGRIKSGDFGEAFERLRDFGIGRDVLEAQGLEFDKSGQYQGSVKQAFDAIQTIIHDRFGGQMEEQSKTIGGIFSNIRDQASFALTDVGEQLIKVFNLKELGTGLVTAIGNLRTGFLSLPEPIQKGAVLLATLTAATGPLLFGIGSVIKLLPVLRLGLASLGGPVTLVAAGVVAAAYLIITNWDSIKAVLTNTGIWDTVVSVVKAATDTVKAVFSFAVQFVKNVWASLGGYLLPVARFLGETLGTIFRTAAGVLTGIFKTLTGVLTGDWGKFREGLQNITGSLWNGIISTFSAGASVTGRLFAAFLDTIGAKGLADAVRAKTDSIAKGINNIKIALIDAQRVGKEGITLPEVTVKAKATVKTGLSGLSTTNNGSAGSASDAQKTFTVLETLQRIVKSIQNEIQTKRSLNIDVPATTFKLLENTQAQIRRIKGDIDKPLTIQVKGIGLISTNFQTESDRIQNFTDGFKSRIEELKRYGTLGFYSDQIDKIRLSIAQLSLKNLTIPPEAFNSLKDYIAQINKANRAEHNKTTQAEDDAEDDRKDQLPVVANFGLFKILDDSKDKMVDVLHKLKEDISSALKDTAQAAFVGMGEIVGGLAAGTVGIQAIPQLLLGTLGGLLKQLGTIAIQAAIGLTAIKTALKTLNPVVALVAGVGLIALGTAIQSGVSKTGSNIRGYAKGGVFKSETLGRFGEYAGAALNPEIATPERLMASTFRRELQDYSRQDRAASAGQPRRIQIEVTGKVRGKDLHLVASRYVDSLDDFS